MNILETFYNNYRYKIKNYKNAIKYEELFDEIEKLDLLFNINHKKNI